MGKYGSNNLKDEGKAYNFKHSAPLDAYQGSLFYVYHQKGQPDVGSLILLQFADHTENLGHALDPDKGQRLRNEHVGIHLSL